MSAVHYRLFFTSTVFNIHNFLIPRVESDQKTNPEEQNMLEKQTNKQNSPQFWLTVNICSIFINKTLSICGLKVLQILWVQDLTAVISQLSHSFTKNMESFKFSYVNKQHLKKKRQERAFIGKGNICNMFSYSLSCLFELVISKLIFTTVSQDC